MLELLGFFWKKNKLLFVFIILMLPLLLMAQQDLKSTDKGPMKCLTGKIAFKQAVGRDILVDKIIKLSSSTWEMPLSVASFSVVAVSTTPAYYFVAFDDLRISDKDTRLIDLLNYTTTYTTVNKTQIQFYDFMLHNCRLNTDGKCTVDKIWKK